MAEHARIGVVPTAADLLDAPERAMELAPTTAAALLARFEGTAAVLRLAAMAPARNGESAALHDEMLTAEQAARRTGMSKRWLYRHAPDLPFARRIGRAVRFSPAGIERWLSARKTLKGQSGV